MRSNEQHIMFMQIEIKLTLIPWGINTQLSETDKNNKYETKYKKFRKKDRGSVSTKTEKILNIWIVKLMQRLHE